MLFNKKKQQEYQHIEDARPIHDPLSAVPLIPEHVDMRKNDDGIVYLRSQPTVKGLRDNLTKILKQDYSRKVELDKYGSFCYALVDGRHNIKYIAEQFAEWTKQDQHEANLQIITFFQELMKKNLIALQIKR